MGLALLVLAAGGAWAQTPACPLPDASDSSIASALADLPQCQRNAAWLAELGKQLINRGLYTEAVEHLERSLMLEPDLPGAILDYAIALAGVGDSASALALLQSQLDNPRLAEPQRSQLALQIERWQNDSAGNRAQQWQHQWQATTRLAYDSNLLGAPDIDSLTITLQGQAVSLPLGAAYRSQGGAYLATHLAWQADLQTAAGPQWQLGASVQTHASPRVPDANTQQATLSAERSFKPTQAGATGNYATASLYLLDGHAGTQFSTVATGVGLQWAHHPMTWLPSCQSRTGLEWQVRKLHSNPLLSGQYSGLLGLWGCEPESGPLWQIMARHGHDTPQDPARAGGEQQQTMLRALLRWSQPAVGAQVHLDLTLDRKTDARGYSPLLADVIRTVDRAAVQLELQRPISTGWRAHLGLERVAQTATLPQFQLQSWGAYLALRYAQ